MEERETAQDIDRTATRWVARMDRGPLSATEEQQLKQWLSADLRHRGAFIRARAIWLRSESASALGPQYDPKAFQPAVAQPRRRLMNWGGAVAASFVLALILMATLQMPVAYATAKGEMRTVPLGNGTTVTLNTDTRIKVYEEKGRRRIRVLRGEVLIEGAGAAAPTLVEVDGEHWEASAATFVVRRLEGQVTQVLVQDGRVVRSEETRSKILPLTPNMGRELAWREGKIALQGETLAQAAAVYARYSDMPIVVVDADLAQSRVTGLFAVNNPLGFSRAVAEVFGAEVRQEEGRIVIDRAP